VALFSVFRHTHESALYTIAKRGREFTVFRGRQRLGGAQSLADLLEVFRSKPALVPA